MFTYLWRNVQALHKDYSLNPCLLLRWTFTIYISSYSMMTYEIVSNYPYCNNNGLIYIVKDITLDFVFDA